MNFYDVNSIKHNMFRKKVNMKHNRKHHLNINILYENVQVVSH